MKWSIEKLENIVELTPRGLINKRADQQEGFRKLAGFLGTKPNSDLV